MTERRLGRQTNKQRRNRQDETDINKDVEQTEEQAYKKTDKQTDRGRYVHTNRNSSTHCRPHHVGLFGGWHVTPTHDAAPRK